MSLPGAGSRGLIRHVVCYSGGIASALVATEVVRRYGTEHTVLVNHDISSWTEDPDIKRFKREVAKTLGITVTQVNIGGELDPDKIPDQFDVCMKAKAFKVGQGTELCTARLKTEPFMDWLRASCPVPQEVTCYYGFEAHETDRIERRRLVLGEMGFNVAFPVAEWERTIFDTREIGSEPPETYEVWKHGNCQGCLKAGLQHWYVVWCRRPDVWAKAKIAEAYIKYTIHREGSLESLEPRFAAMQAAGVPATEQIPSGQFWSIARKRVKVWETSKAPLPGLFATESHAAKLPLL